MGATVQSFVTALAYLNNPILIYAGSFRYHDFEVSLEPRLIVWLAELQPICERLCTGGVT
jgi:hypothetical protein